MAKHTPSIAKNQMRRCLRAIVDPLPTAAEVAALRAYFFNECAYCGDGLPIEERSGQLDHVVAHSKGGTNSIFNHVLSCGRCNGDDKREMPWENFLATRELNPENLEKRRLHIEGWLDRQVGKTLLGADVQMEVEAIVVAAQRNFDTYVQAMRELRERHTRGA